MKFTGFILLVMFFASAGARAFECEDTPEGMYVYQDGILEIAKKNLSVTEFRKAVDQPLRCLLQTFKTEGGFTRYVAGACLRRLFGGPEIRGFHRGRAYEKVLKNLLAEQIRQGDLFKNSEISVFAMVEWEEYQPFCKGTAESDCVELLPDPEQVAKQTELLGASSMLVLRAAYKQFSGESKRRVAETITKLYQQTPKQKLLERRMIEEIYQEMQQPLTHLKQQKS